MRDVLEEVGSRPEAAPVPCFRQAGSMTGRSPSSSEQRVWSKLPAGTRAALERDLAPTDLQTLLLAVARARAEKVTAARVMRRWREDRFVRPSPHEVRKIV